MLARCMMTEKECPLLTYSKSKRQKSAVETADDQNCYMNKILLERTKDGFYRFRPSAVILLTL